MKNIHTVLLLVMLLIITGSLKSEAKNLSSPNGKIEVLINIDRPNNDLYGSASITVKTTLVTDVSEPSKVTNTSWIVPGPASWIYWAYNNGSNNFQLVKEYVDLAVEMNWPYNLVLTNL